MAKKTWIKLKRGILEPKHVQAVGPALWIFNLMIDSADWETGIVHAWTDRQAASDLGLKLNTVRDWRQRLERYGYISSKQVGQALQVQIHNWTNPREYSGEVSNQNRTVPADVGDAWGDVEGDVQTEPLRGKGSVPGDVPGDVPPLVPSLSPHPTYQPIGKNKESRDGHFTCLKCGELVSEANRGTKMADDCRLHATPALRRR